MRRSRWFVLLLVLSWAPNALAVTRYVNQSGGSDGNDCNQSQSPTAPKQTIGSNRPCMQPGDITIIGAGTYAESLSIKSGNNAVPTGGSAALPFTWRAASGATVVLTRLPYTYNAQAAYYIFDGFIFDGQHTGDARLDDGSGRCACDNWTIGGDPATLGVSHHITVINSEIKRWYGVGLLIGAGGSGGGNNLIKNNRIHQQYGWNEDFFRFYGIYVSDSDNNVIEDNLIYDNPGGGVQVYPGPQNGTILRRNKIYLNNRYSTSSIGGIIVSGGLTNVRNTLIYENEIYNNANVTGVLAAGIDLNTSSGTKIYNNTIHNNKNCGIYIRVANASLNQEIRNNIILDNGNAPVCDNSSQAGTTLSNNITTGTIATYVVNPATADYTLKSGSGAIDAGVNLNGYPPNGSTLDVGRHEAFTISAAAIDTHVIEVTLGIGRPSALPILPSAGITGFSLACTGTGCSTTIASASRKANNSSTIQLDVSGISGNACNAGTQTYTLSYNSATGNVTDQFGQKLWTVSNRSVVLVCTGSVTPPPTGGLQASYLLDESAGPTAVSAVNSPAMNATHTNGPTVVTGKTGNALSFLDGSTQSLAIPYGSSLDPTTTPLTICLGVLLHDANVAQKIVFSTANGTSQRFYVGPIGGTGTTPGTWGLGMQASGFTTGSEFVATTDWTRICLRADATGAQDTADRARLFVNGIKGNIAGFSYKDYTSFTLASNFQAGTGSFDVNFGGSTIDDIKIYNTALSDAEIAADYTAWNPSSPPPAGTLTIAACQFLNPRRTSTGAAAPLQPLNQPITVRQAGYLALECQLDGSGSDPSAFSPKLYYSPDAWTTGLPVPDTAGQHGLSFYGDTADPSIVNDTAISYALTTGGPAGSGTVQTGSTQLTAAATPNVDLALNTRTVLRYVLTIDPTVATGQQRCLKLYNQNGLPLNGGYTPAGGLCFTTVSAAGTVF